MTGLRRSLAEPGVTGAVLLATALAAGSFTVATLLTDSTAVVLSEKAAVFLGSDLSIDDTRHHSTTPTIRFDGNDRHAHAGPQRIPSS